MRTIAKYPKFTILRREHKEIVEKYTCLYEPYCDIRFALLMSWTSPKHPTKISKLNNNLVILLDNYIAGEKSVILLGKTKIEESIQILFEKETKMRLVPEEIAMHLKDSNLAKQLKIEPDPDNFDYILDLEKVAKLKSKELKAKRKSINKFIKRYPDVEVVILNSNKHNLLSDLKELLSECSVEKTNRQQEIEEEFMAITGYIKHQDLYNSLIVGFKLKNKLIGFTLNEVDGTISHGIFGRALAKYKGLYDFAEHKTAELLLALGGKYLNLEQDMGIEGLRKYKLGWKPVRVLKKYTITKK